MRIEAIKPLFSGNNIPLSPENIICDIHSFIESFRFSKLEIADLNAINGKWITSMSKITIETEIHMFQKFKCVMCITETIEIIKFGYKIRGEQNRNHSMD